MTIAEFNSLWLQFGNEMTGISHLTDEARVNLFRTYFEAYSKEKAIQASGLGQLQQMMGPMVEQITKEFQDQQRSEEWRGDTH